ncbi:neutral zinc metallopeptidase [Flavobacterium branchiophilum]|uniref:Metalloprotease n=2 Tax=Flavobacterium branchiophilum TaxID=55197 RepID=A0A2H3KER7_9FLAO|nr:neutral zinc metallopeptidase [Flavobacterium branchiophilum]PDS26849.1 metalloprotease [Flavobacterium branchiophilum]CCB69605.1 Probable metalloprotease [Flavobacterium branchiophilum FL-15]
MKWIGRRQSDNVEDQRGVSGGGKALVGGGAIGIIILLLNLFGGQTGKMLTPMLEQVQQNQQTQQTTAAPLSQEDKKMGEFAATVLADTEDVWTTIFEQYNGQYEKPKMVLFTGEVQTACGGASAASGPFYCPGDHKVYMDLDFFQELQTRFGAKGGDFAIAYVIAHEVGHHVQNLLGTSTKMRQMQEGKSEAEANRLSVALELQADFYAGVWAKYNQKYLDVDDIDEALSAAQAVGDDAIQSKMQGHVVPESFTHGTSAQRKHWFMKGFQTGDIKQGNTFESLE